METQPSLPCAAHVGARKGKGEGPALHSQVVEVNEGKKKLLSSVPGSLPCC